MYKYSIVLWLICVPLLLSAQSLFKADSFYLSGHIKQYSPVGYQLIKIIYNRPYGGSQEQLIAQIDSSGHFSAVVPILNPQELMLRFSNTMINVYAIPGKRLQMEIHEVKQVNSAEDLAVMLQSKQSVSFTGTAAAVNNNLNDYTYRLNKIFSPLANDQQYSSLPAEAYKILRINKMNEQLDSLRAWNKQNSMEALYFERTKKTIVYTAAADLLMRWIVNNDKDSLPPLSYQTFIQQLALNDKHAILTDAYYDFLNDYGIYLSRLSPNRFAYIQEKIAAGPARDLMLSRIAVDSMEQNNVLHPSTLRYLQQHISSPVLYQRLLGINKNVHQVLNNAMPDKTTLLASGPETTADILQTLGQKYKGKVVYVDFWAPWCGPCISEMKQVRLLKKAFADKPVVFLYLAIHCDSTSWEKSIRIEQIQGEHYRLSENEFDQLNKRISVTSIPRYMLIDRNGNIVNINARRPDQLDDLTTDINNLL